MKHVVQFSGGAGSWAAAKRVVERYGASNTTLLTCDTRSEHEDWREFVHAAAEDMGARSVLLDSGVDIWELANEQRMIPNTMADFCSRLLKREPSLKWLEDNCEREHTVVHMGFDFTEDHRLNGTLAYREGWPCDMPLMWEPMLDKDAILQELKESSLPFPVAYQLGLPHNNCLKYGCVKGGQAYWKRLLEEMPETYMRSENNEEVFRAMHGNYAIMKRRRDGESKPLSLRQFRLEITDKPDNFDKDDYGDCNCFGENK